MSREGHYSLVLPAHCSFVVRTLGASWYCIIKESFTTMIRRRYFLRDKSVCCWSRREAISLDPAYPLCGVVYDTHVEN